MKVTMKTKLACLVMMLFFLGCGMPTSESVKDAEGFLDIVSVENFREDAAVGLSWRRDAGADRYILMRSIDGIYGAEPFETIYEGNETSYTDRNTEADIRYLYRLDKVYNGETRYGAETSLGIGTRGEIDVHEPNNGQESAVELIRERSGNIYFYRFSDGRTLNDSDWYKVLLSADASANIRIQESNAGAESSFSVSIPGKPLVDAANNEIITIKNESGESAYIFFGMYPKTESFVINSASGGTIRSYKIILDSVSNAGGNDDNDDNDDDNNSGDENNNDDDSNNEDDDSGNDDNNNDDENNNDDDNNNEDENEEDNGDLVEQSGLFTEEDGWINFLTNEKKYSSTNHTFWRRFPTNQTSFTAIKMSLVKESGNADGGYGFFFRGGITGGAECMLTILIRTNGTYSIGKIINNRYTELAAWNPEAYLRYGFGVVNTVEVSFDTRSNQYVLIINGLEANRFTDRPPICTGFDYGIAAVVTQQERFPNFPVKVKYKEL